MSKLTDEQQLAVDKKNTNIIVSAGAGSGKTTVLKTRVLRELKEGVNVNDLIILTFTNNAAQEMKERIRKTINENPDVASQGELIDSAYITTFDSFAQSLVKKYNYLLNINKAFTIVDSTIVNTEMVKIIDDIFDELYKSHDEKFERLIKELTVKDDKDIKASIISVYHSLINLIDRDAFLDTYMDKYYEEEYVDSLFEEFENYIFSKVNKLVEMLEELEEEIIDADKLALIEKETEGIRNSQSYDDILDSLDFKLPNKSDKIYTEYGMELKEKIGNIRKALKEDIVDPKEMLIKHYLSTKDYVEVIIRILKELDERIMTFKTSHNAYEFNDIALKAIELVRDNPDVAEEIKNRTFEIMIDEYQDTNDIQETFISYIENNNVYMVGDIKQSIYRFRNANPYIFKAKYDKYKDGINGFKIDLNKNFRSRNEVIFNINLIFDNIMFDDIGGANYKTEHQMVFGNTSYNSIQKSDYNMEILNYNNDTKAFKNDEIECFIMAEDILRRIRNKEQVVYFDKDGLKSRDIEFSDIVILVDKGRNFELVKKVLETNHIAATIDKDISIKDEDEIYILKNVITLIISIKKGIIDARFKHCYLSIARSYVFKMNDREIFDIFNREAWKESALYLKCEEIANKIDGMSNKEILTYIIESFDIVNKLVLVGSVEERLSKLEYFINNAIALNKFGMDIYDMNNYFEEVLHGDNDIKMSSSKASGNAVKIMTIHKSKGLEFSYVYLPFLASDFNKKVANSKFKFSNKFGVITPFYDNGRGETFVKDLYNHNERLEELSERIRLFYVALTRAKEKFIMITSIDEKIAPIEGEMRLEDLENAKSYMHLIALLKYKLNGYIKEVDLNSLEINTNYNEVLISNYKDKIQNTREVIKVDSIKLDNSVLDNKHFSKRLSKVIDQELKDKLDFGTFMHYVFEVYDFNNDNMDSLDIEDMYKDKIRNFLRHDETKNIKNAKIYKEHEIHFESDEATFHGFIDLLVEYPDHFDIIDYKLSNINSEEYNKQLKGYKDYIEKKYKKTTYAYLYSINKDEFKKII